jgi:hypothetical protein
LRLKNERHGDAVRAIRSDNGSEFKNSHFETFCRDLDLEHQFYSPYVACQNGVVKRKNRSLCEMARTMLDEHRTPRRYWAEAVNTACYDGNRIFLRAFLNKTCYELMHGRAPRVRMMLERMMVMMLKLQPRMYPLLPLRRLRCRMVHPLHHLRSSKIKWKRPLRGRLFPDERYRGAFKLIIHPQ